MSGHAGMTARALYEASAHAAISRYHASLDQMARKPAYATLIDDLLKAADIYALGAAEARRLEEAHARAIDDALNKVMQDATPEDVIRAERTDIGRQPTYGTKAAAR